MFQALLFPSRRASFTVAVILLPFSCQSHKIWSACGTMKWSVSPVFYPPKDGTRYSSLHIWDMHKSKISLLFICGVIAALEALIGLCHTIFFFFCTHTFSCSTPSERQWRRYLWEVEFECQFCVCFLCLWLEWRQSVYVKVCWWFKSMWIHFKAIKSSGYCWCSRVQ